MHRLMSLPGSVLTAPLALVLILPLATADAAGFKTLFDFKKGNRVGSTPFGGLSADSAGNLYGTTNQGGKGASMGTVFELPLHGRIKALHTFSNSADGLAPQAGVILDSSGDLYGTTSGGGTYGYGVVYEIHADGQYTVLHNFAGGADGIYPAANLYLDNKGNLFGTTVDGGTGPCDYGCGTVFEIAAGNQESVLYSFSNGSDGGFPNSALISDANGNLYGTTLNGGNRANCTGDAGGCGVVFKLAPDGAETVLYSFQGGGDGAYPYAALTFDTAGNLYGTTRRHAGVQCPRMRYNLQARG